MPLVQIDVEEGFAPAALQALADGVHEAMVAALAIPPDDHFQIVTAHKPGQLIWDRGYLGVKRSEHGFALVRITMRSGRTVPQKRALYRGIADRAAAAGLRPGDVMVVVTENDLIDWSFGAGIAQYVPEETH